MIGDGRTAGTTEICFISNGDYSRSFGLDYGLMVAERRLQPFMKLASSNYTLKLRADPSVYL
jgi:hypothetical protein